MTPWLRASLAVARTLATSRVSTVARRLRQSSAAALAQWRFDPRGRTIPIVTSVAKKVLEAALALPADAREELVGALSISLEPVTLSPEWRAEIARRLETIEKGEAIFYDAEDHLQELRAKYG